MTNLPIARRLKSVLPAVIVIATASWSLKFISTTITAEQMVSALISHVCKRMHVPDV